LSLVALCLPLFAIASSAALAASALFALGVASASTNTASNALSSELFPHERGRRMNGIAVMVGLGGLAMPTTTVLAANLVSWRAAVSAGAVLAAAIALFIGVRPLHTSSPTLSDPTGTIAALRRYSRQPGFVWCLLLILLGGGNEASMAGWTSTFVIASGFGSATATGVLASHWLGVIVSRALFANRVDREKEVAVERSAVLSTLALVVLVVSASPAMVMLGPFTVGLCIALVMPTSLAIAGERLPGNPGALFGAMLTVAQVGGILLPSLIGLVAEYTSVRAGLAILIGSYGAIALIVRHLSSDLFQQSVKAG
jgi:fucose permease